MASVTLISVEALAESVNRWCAEHGVVPTNGQSGERITERNIRYYRTRGLLDAPGSETGERRRGFSERHISQLRVIRLFQARSLPLEQIQDQMRDRSTAELQELEREELRKLNGAAASLGGSLQEQWQVSTIGGEYLVISRRGRALSEEQRRQVAAVLGVPLAAR